MICCTEMVLVRRTIFTRGDLVMIARMASRPGSRGIRTSSRRMSGSSSDLNDLLHGNGAGEKDNLYPRRLGHDRPHGFQTGEPRHQDVEQENVGFEFESLSDGIVATLGLTEDFEAELVLEQVSDTEADFGMIVGDDDPYGDHATGGSGLLWGLLTHCA